ncbi:MAG: SufE family protein [Spirochaetes bacterium]|nr:SufE family protein [Spirochaetota bacterium]
MTIAETQEALLAEFASCGDWDARYQKLILLGKALPPMPEAMRIDANKIKGCQAQVWLFPEWKGGLVYFHADSDALIVKGIVALLVRIYNGQAPAAILSEPLTLIDKLELTRYLTPTRANGLSAMLKQLRLFAYALQARQAPA